MTGTGLAAGPRVLHVIVGHGLPTYFRNAVRSVRAVAPADPLLVIDNASPCEDLRTELARLGERDPNIHVILRTTNDLTGNRKVGSLYAAYETAFEMALARGFSFLHLMQADFQMLWWDRDLIARSGEIFEARPRCVNIHMQFRSRDSLLADASAPPGADGLTKLRGYGLTDTGLYHLGRWRAHAMAFGPSERGHAKRYLDAGFEVICHPWPTDAPIPWPAVVRNGVRRGREVPATKPFLLRPLSPDDVEGVKDPARQAWLEDVCVPWGWVCATPMWVTGLESIDYWVMRYRDARKNGLTYVLPRWERRGVGREDRRKVMRIWHYRPSLFRLFVVAPAAELAARAARVLRHRRLLVMTETAVRGRRKESGCAQSQDIQSHDIQSQDMRSLADDRRG